MAHSILDGGIMRVGVRAALRSLKVRAAVARLADEVATVLHPPCQASLAEKVAFLSAPGAYPHGATAVDRRETHMSWVFLADRRAYKLKKPVRFDYLDFSTLAKREAACRTEVRLNAALAPGVYLGVEPLRRGYGRLSLGGGEGEIVDWLVVMRRLDEAQTLESILKTGGEPQMGPFADTLARYYRRAAGVRRSPAVHLAHWRRSLRENAAVLRDPRLPTPRGLARRVLASQATFLRRRAPALARRALCGRILDGHGDLRPEHIWMTQPIRVIDRLEFNAALRAVDPLDEVASLEVELELLGARRESAALRRRLLWRLGDHAAPELHLFYRIYRATLRARLSIAHLLEPNPRTPQKWPAQTRAYLAIAARDATILDRRLRRPSAP